MLLARFVESLPLVCPNCGTDMRIIAFVTETAPVQRLLAPIGEPPRPPSIAHARGPPAWDLEPMPDWDLIAPPRPGFEFDHSEPHGGPEVGVVVDPHTPGQAPLG